MIIDIECNVSNAADSVCVDCVATVEAARWYGEYSSVLTTAQC